MPVVSQNNSIKMLTINEAAKSVPGLSPYTVRRMVLEGTLPAIKSGRKYLICDKILIETICNGTPQKNKNEAVNGITPIY